VGDAAVAAMAAAGLIGLEVDHPDHDEDDRADAAALAAELELVPTGSSDYHGHDKVTRLGQCTTDPTALERLLSSPTALSPLGTR
jgi:predicted metal-dependent phosphoesterase TrpH